MKRNLLMLLFAMLMGVFCVNAQKTITIDVDNAASVNATDGVYGTPISLHDGINSVELSNNPLSIQAAPGASITSVTCDGLPINANGAGMYNIGVVEGMQVKIITSGAAASSVEVMFAINNPESATVTSDGVTTPITNYANIGLKLGEYAVIAPVEGYVIESCQAYSIDDWKQNEDGTVSFMPAQYGYINLVTKMKGIDFTVDVNVPSNVIINAFSASNEDLGVVTLGYVSPYAATAPMAAQSLVFSAPEGGEIKSIIRVMADGTENNVNYSSYAGWRSMVTDGDKFVIDAVGPEATVTFWGYGPNWSELDLSNFIIKAGDKAIELTGTQTNGTARVGDILTVTAGKGYALQEYNAVSGDCVNPIIKQGAVQTAMITRSGNVFLNAVIDNSMIISVDNAAAVKVIGANGNGDVLALQDGENKFETVANPLKITAADKYEIVSVSLDGEAVTPQGGAYTVELLAGSTLEITTREIPSEFHVTIMTMGGDIDNLVITKEGEVVDYSAGLTAMVGEEITIAPRLGYMIESVTDMNGNGVELNEDTDVWTVSLIKSASMISVMFKQAAEGKAFVGFSRDSSDVLAYLYNKDGERKEDPASLKAGRTIEVEIGDLVEINLWGNNRDLSEVTVNGTKVEFNAGAHILDRIKITERTVIDVTTVEHEQLVEVVGYESIETTVGTGALIGTVFINEVGQKVAQLRPGEKFYVIPVPAKGYKFEGFASITHNLPVPEPVDGKYEFTVPEDVEYVMFKGNFVLDEENPVYLIEGNTIYDDGEGASRKLMGLTRIYDGTEQGAQNVYASAGEVVRLMFFLNIDEFPEKEYYCESFCLYNNPEVLIAQNYVVNPEDVRDNNIISIGAIVKKRNSSVAEAMADGSLVYDAATATVKSSADVKVFTISGQLVKEISAGEGSLETLPAGLYILTNGSETVKIVK